MNQLAKRLVSADGAQFLEVKAAADFLGNGAIEVNMYEKEIVDIVRRSDPLLQRIPSPPATGHPHRYFEQTAIATAAFTDPRNISPAATSPTRVENSALIRAITNQTNLSLFDVDVTRQQGQFAYLEAKDIEDLVSSVEVLRAQQVWVGNSTTLLDTGHTAYCGLLTQITQQATIAPGASIIDGLKAQVATMVANQNYVVKPTGIYLNPILGDYIDREAKATKIDLGNEVVGGVKVNTLMTQAGPLPLIGSPFVPSDTTSKYGFGAPPAGNKNYYASIVMENMLEMPYVGGADQNPNPRIFQLGLLGGLQGQYVVIKFDSAIAKGPSYAHSVVAVQRP
jgi:hypothetical protein